MEIRLGSKSFGFRSKIYETVALLIVKTVSQKAYKGSAKLGLNSISRLNKKQYVASLIDPTSIVGRSIDRTLFTIFLDLC